MPTKLKRRPARRPSTSRAAARSSRVTRVTRVTAVKPKRRPVPSVNGSANNHRVRSARATASAVSEKETVQEMLLTQPHSMEEYLLRIRALGDRIRGYVQFMGSIEKLNGSCLEAKRRSMAIFYDRLVMMDRELNRIQEELELG